LWQILVWRGQKNVNIFSAFNNSFWGNFNLLANTEVLWFRENYKYKAFLFDFINILFGGVFCKGCECGIKMSN
jgi:hypothetical protein